MAKKVKFRCDGNSTLGLGHIVRCVSLAALLEDNFEISFYTLNCPVSATEIITARSFLHVNITDENSFLEDIYPTDIVVIDGYHFNADYQIYIKAKGCKLVCVDDLAAIHFVADMIINHTPGIEPSFYQNKIAPYTRLYLGLTYALLRKAFLEVTFRRNVPQKLDRAFICLGGADPQNKTLQIIRDLIPAHVSHIDIVLGSAYAHMQELDMLVGDDSKYNIHRNIGEDEMCQLIQKNDFAIVSASTISFECMFVGIPLYVDLAADNQEYNYKYLLKKQVAFPIEAINNYTFEAGSKMLAVQRQISGERKATSFSKIFTSEL